MNRPVPVGLAIVVALTAVSATHASPQRISPRIALVNSFQSQLVRVSTLSGQRLLESTRPGDRQDSDAAAPVRQTAEELRISNNAFSPATVVPQLSGIASNATADSDFGASHGATYEALHRTTGYRQRADWKPDATKPDTAIFRYLGSIFPDSAAAHNAWQDGVSHTQQIAGSQPNDCSAGVQAPCSTNGFVKADGVTAIVYGIVQVNQCLLEVSAEYTKPILDSHANELASVLGTVLAAAFAASQAGCGAAVPLTVIPLTPGQVVPTPLATLPAAMPVDFTLDAISVRSHKTLDASKRPLKTAKANKPLYLFVYFTLRSGPANTRVAVTFTLQTHNRILFTRAVPHKSPITPPSREGDYVPVRFKLPGTYTFVGRVTIGNTFREGRYTFKIVK